MISQTPKWNKTMHFNTTGKHNSAIAGASFGRASMFRVSAMQDIPEDEQMPAFSKTGAAGNQYAAPTMANLQSLH